MELEDLEAHLTKAVVQSSPLDLLPELLARTITEDTHALHKILFALYRVFAAVLRSQYYAPTVTSAVAEIRSWLEQHIERYTNILISLLDHTSLDIRVSSQSPPFINQCLSRHHLGLFPRHTHALV
jgi:hypothetical protein